MPPQTKLKKWSKPECVKVKLVPEETMIKGCKTNIQGGPEAYGCNRVNHGNCQGQAS